MAIAAIRQAEKRAGTGAGTGFDTHLDLIPAALRRIVLKPGQTACFPRPARIAPDFALHRCRESRRVFLCFGFNGFGLKVEKSGAGKLGSYEVESRVFAMIESGKSLQRDVESLRRSEAATGCLMAARNALRKGERERAKELIKEAFTHVPGDIAALDLLGDMLLEDGETAQALRLFERALQAHPGNANFEEKLGICRLDLAEIEADKQFRLGAILVEEKGKIFERSLGKAVTLSLLLPGAGQFYNDENEKGAAYLAANLVSSVLWFYPLQAAQVRLPSSQGLDFGLAIRSMTSLESVLFFIGATVWSGVYTASLLGAMSSTKRYNDARRAALGL